ncbi:unnamed protein product, partial [Iphiclides podalirius]
MSAWAYLKKNVDYGRELLACNREGIFGKGIDSHHVLPAGLYFSDSRLLIAFVIKMQQHGVCTGDVRWSEGGGRGGDSASTVWPARARCSALAPPAATRAPRDLCVLRMSYPTTLLPSRPQNFHVLEKGVHQFGPGSRHTAEVRGQAEEGGGGRYFGGLPEEPSGRRDGLSRRLVATMCRNT